MKFVCEVCGARYYIDDEKVRGKVLRIRCKKCSHIMSVRGLDRPESTPDQVPFARRRRTEVRRAIGSDDRIENLRRSLATDANQAVGASDEAPATEHWYYAINGETYGPYSEDELIDRFGDGRIGDEAYVWQQGFSEWKPAYQVPVFQGAMTRSREVVRRKKRPRTVQLDAADLAAMQQAADDELARRSRTSTPSGTAIVENARPIERANGARPTRTDVAPVADPDAQEAADTSKGGVLDEAATVPAVAQPAPDLRDQLAAEIADVLDGTSDDDSSGRLGADTRPRVEGHDFSVPGREVRERTSNRPGLRPFREPERTAGHNAIADLTKPKAPEPETPTGPEPEGNAASEAVRQRLGNLREGLRRRTTTGEGTPVRSGFRHVPIEKDTEAAMSAATVPSIQLPDTISRLESAEKQAASDAADAIADAVVVDEPTAEEPVADAVLAGDEQVDEDLDAMLHDVDLSEADERTSAPHAAVDDDTAASESGPPPIPAAADAGAAVTVPIARPDAASDDADETDEADTAAAEAPDADEAETLEAEAPEADASAEEHDVETVEADAPDADEAETLEAEAPEADASAEEHDVETVEAAAPDAQDDASTEEDDVETVEAAAPDAEDEAGTEEDETVEAAAPDAEEEASAEEDASAADDETVEAAAPDAEVDASTEGDETVEADAPDAAAGADDVETVEELAATELVEADAADEPEPAAVEELDADEMAEVGTTATADADVDPLDESADDEQEDDDALAAVFATPVLESASRPAISHTEAHIAVAKQASGRGVVIVATVALFLIGIVVTVAIARSGDEPETMETEPEEQAAVEPETPEPPEELSAEAQRLMEQNLRVAMLRATDRIDRAWDDAFVAVADQLGPESMAGTVSAHRLAEVQARREADARERRQPASARREPVRGITGSSSAGSATTPGRVTIGGSAGGSRITVGATSTSPDRSSALRPELGRGSDRGPGPEHFTAGLRSDVEPSLQQCHQRHRGEEGDLPQSRVSLQITVEPTGRVSSVEVDRALRDSAFDRCLQTRRDRWSFPPFDGDAVTLDKTYLLQ